MRRTHRTLIVVFASAALLPAISTLAEAGKDGRHAGAERVSAGSGSASDLPGRRARSGRLETVSKVELDRYMGTWYEIARFDNRFQRGTVATTSEFLRRDDGTIAVTMTARKRDLDGKLKKSNARGWIVDNPANAKWKVQFVWPFRSDYWIIDLCDQYSYAVVGQPSRKNVWIISREPVMEKATYDRICKKLAGLGFDPAKLVRTPQPDIGQPTDAHLASSSK